jgi:sulfate permease, SulP family
VVASDNPIFLPKTLTAFAGYGRARFLRDLGAGLSVACVAFPLSIAIGAASLAPVDGAIDVSPIASGLATAAIGGFMISLFGGTRTNIGGPSPTFLVVVATLAAKHGYEGVVVATWIAAAALVFLGATRLGGLVKYVPYPVTTGFTAGIGATILVGQMKDAFGIAAGDGAPAPIKCVQKLAWLFERLPHASLAATLATAACVAFLLMWPRFGLSRLPGPLVVVVVATLVVEGFDLPFARIGDALDLVPAAFPPPRLPDVSWSMVGELVPSGFTIAFVAAIESLLCAVVADGMLGTRHRANTELIGLGIANAATPFFGGMPACGALARTATNIQCGGRTPIAGMAHAVALFCTAVFAGPYAVRIPTFATAAVLIVVALRMAEPRRFLRLLRGPREDALVLLTTFGLTLFADLVVAVQAGVVLAALLFIKRAGEATGVGRLGDDLKDSRADGAASASRGYRKIPGVEIYSIRGSFFFGAAFKLRDTLRYLGAPPKVLIVDLTEVWSADATGLHALEELAARCRRDGAELLLVGASRLSESGALRRLWDASETAPPKTFDDLPSALAAAESIVK